MTQDTSTHGPAPPLENLVALLIGAGRNAGAQVTSWSRTGHGPVTGRGQLNT